MSNDIALAIGIATVLLLQTKWFWAYLREQAFLRRYRSKRKPDIAVIILGLLEDRLDDSSAYLVIRKNHDRIELSLRVDNAATSKSHVDTYELSRNAYMDQLQSRGDVELRYQLAALSRDSQKFVNDSLNRRACP